MDIFKKPIKKFKIGDYIEFDDENKCNNRVVYRIMQIEYGKKINEIDLKLKSVLPTNIGIHKIIWRTSEDLKLGKYKILKTGRILFEKQL